MWDPKRRLNPGGKSEKINYTKKKDWKLDIVIMMLCDNDIYNNDAFLKVD
jgi:hypothetical protein